MENRRIWWYADVNQWAISSSYSYLISNKTHNTGIFTKFTVEKRQGAIHILSKKWNLVSWPRHLSEISNPPKVNSRENVYIQICVHVYIYTCTHIWIYTFSLELTFGGLEISDKCRGQLTKFHFLLRIWIAPCLFSTVNLVKIPVLWVLLEIR